MAETLASDPVMRLPWIGYRIFKLLLAFSILLVAALFVYGYVTFPNSDVILKSQEFPVGTTFPQKLEALDAQRETWTSNIKDLGTIFLVTPIFSLIAAVVGYIFGVSRQGAEPGVVPRAGEGEGEGEGQGEGQGGNAPAEGAGAGVGGGTPPAGGAAGGGQGRP